MFCLVFVYMYKHAFKLEIHLITDSVHSERFFVESGYAKQYSIRIEVIGFSF
jgi:hypothetical protein